MNKSIWECAIETTIARYVKAGATFFDRLSDNKRITSVNLVFTQDDTIVFVIVRPFTTADKGIKKPYDITSSTRNAWENQAVKWLQSQKLMSDTAVTFDVVDAVIVNNKQCMIRRHGNVQSQLNPEEDNDE